MREKHTSPPLLPAAAARAAFLQTKRRDLGNQREANAWRATDLSPYSPLPAIGSRRNSEVSSVSPPSTSDLQPQQPLSVPRLLRQETYVVQEPVFVRGPLSHSRRKAPPRMRPAWVNHHGDAWAGGSTHKEQLEMKHKNAGTYFTIPIDLPPRKNFKRSQRNNNTPDSCWGDVNNQSPIAPGEMTDSEIPKGDKSSCSVSWTTPCGNEKAKGQAFWFQC